MRSPRSGTRRFGLKRRPRRGHDRGPRGVGPGRARRTGLDRRPRGGGPERRPRRDAQSTAFVAGLAVVAVAAGALFGPRAAARVGAWLTAGPPRRIWQIQSVHVTGTHRLTPEAVVAATGLVRGTGLLGLDTGAVEARVEALAPVARARVLRLPPGRLVLGIDERRALGVAELAGGSWLVCAEGVPFAPASEAERRALPRLRGPETGEPGKAQPDLARAAALVGEVRARGLEPAEIAVAAGGAPEGAALRLRGLAARIVLGEEPGPALGRLARLLARRPELAAGAATIDVRFADRAVLRGDAPSGGEGDPADPRGAAVHSPAPEGAGPVAVRRGRAAPPAPPAAGQPVAGTERGDTWHARTT